MGNKSSRQKKKDKEKKEEAEDKASDTNAAKSEQEGQAAEAAADADTARDGGQSDDKGTKESGEVPGDSTKHPTPIQNGPTEETKTEFKESPKPEVVIGEEPVKEIKTDAIPPTISNDVPVKEIKTEVVPPPVEEASVEAPKADDIVVEDIPVIDPKAESPVVEIPVELPGETPPKNEETPIVEVANTEAAVQTPATEGSVDLHSLEESLPEPPPPPADLGPPEESLPLQSDAAAVQEEFMAASGTESLAESGAADPSVEEASQGETAAPSQPTPDEESLTKTIATEFRWEEGGQAVQLMGSFDNWKEKVSLIKQDGIFQVTLHLNAGEYLYKFIVDDQYVVNKNLPVRSDDEGQESNLVIVEKAG